MQIAVQESLSSCRDSPPLRCCCVRNIANVRLARGAQCERDRVSARDGCGRRASCADSDRKSDARGDWRCWWPRTGYVRPQCASEAADRCGGAQRGGIFSRGSTGCVRVHRCVTLLTGIIFGLAPAWLAARGEVSGTLKETAQSASRRRKGLTGRSIVAFQIALSTLLVVVPVSFCGRC